MSDDLRPWYRLGYVSPHPTVDTLAYEIYRMAPPGLMLVTTGLAIGDYTPRAVEAELPAFDRAVSLLVGRRVQRVVLSGVPIAAALGRARVLALLEEVGARAGVTVDTDLEAIVAAARHLGTHRVALATRWKDDVNRALAEYLGEAGIEVTGTVSSPGTMAENARLDDGGGMALATQLGGDALRSSPGAEALVMPGARWVAIHTLEALEREHGRPVLLNHASALWAALRSAGYDRPVTGWGRLLGSLG